MLNASPVLNNQLQPTAEALVDFQDAPGVFNGLDLLTDTNELLKPALRFIAPAQTTCNYVTLTFRNLVLSTSGGNDLGHWLNFISFAPPTGRTRGQPRLGPGQRPGTRKPPALQPVSRTRQPPASRAAAKPATRSTSPARP